MKQLLTTVLTLFFIGVLSAQQPKVNQDRLEDRIFNLAEFGLQENGETEIVFI